MTYFLLVYHKGREELVDQYSFPIEDRAAALAKRRDLQHRFFDVPELEVVLLGAERFEDLQKTHSRYFKKSSEIMRARAV